MGARRRYAEACAAAHALDLVGERWALLVVRELLLGPKRFTDLRQSLPTISPNVLTQRLAELEAAGVLIKRRLPPPVAVCVYELTEWGLELESVIKALGRWGARSPLRLADARLSVDSLILFFRTMGQPQRAAGLDASIELRFGDDVFHARVAHGAMEIVRGAADHADAVMATDVQTLASVVYGGREFTDAVRSQELRVEGDKKIVRRWLTMFTLPEPASLPR